MLGQKVKINCTDFSSEKLRFTNYIFKLMSRYYDLEVSDDPEIVLYSCFGQEFLKYNCLRIYYTGENTRPNFKQCDYAFSFDHSDHPRHYRLPDYATYEDTNELVKEKDIDSIVSSKTKFCEFTYSNPFPQERIRFFKALSKYKKVDSFGKVLNNTPDVKHSGDRNNINWMKYKRDFLSPYKFSIAFENESYPGYLTEKILYAMLTNTIPIYWGNPDISKDFNTKSFINCHEYRNFDEVIERVIEIDENQSLYRQYLAESYYHNNKIPEILREENILKQLDDILHTKDKIVPVARQQLQVTKKEMRSSIFGQASFMKKVKRRMQGSYYRYKYCH